MIRTAALGLLFAFPAMAEEPPAFAPGPVTAAETLWLFDAACLSQHPDFDGADGILDDFGFTDYDTVVQRQHPWKELAIIVVSKGKRGDAAARSCAVSGSGVYAAEVESDLRRLVQTRIGEIEERTSPTTDGPGRTWSVTRDGAATTIFMAELLGGTSLVASVVPLRQQRDAAQ